MRVRSSWCWRCAPLVTGVIARARGDRADAAGPAVLQPYYDIAQAAAQGDRAAGRRRAGVPGGALRVASPAYATVPLLIPVLTELPAAARLHGRHPRRRAHPRRWRASWSRSRRSTAAARTRSSARAGCGRSARSASRRSSSSIFTVALTTHTDLPYVLGATLRVVGGRDLPPSAPAGRRRRSSWSCWPRRGASRSQSHGGTLEFGMIEEARTLEHSGPGLAFLRWGSSVKQLVLFVILANVLRRAVGAGGRRAPRSRRSCAIALLFVEGARYRPRDRGDRVVASRSCGCTRSPSSPSASFLLAVLAVIIFTVRARRSATRG